VSENRWLMVGILVVSNQGNTFPTIDLRAGMNIRCLVYIMFGSLKACRAEVFFREA
jgi:hypothetical protein